MNTAALDRIVQTLEIIESWRYKLRNQLSRPGDPSSILVKPQDLSLHVQEMLYDIRKTGDPCNDPVCVSLLEVSEQQSQLFDHITRIRKDLREALKEVEEEDYD